MIYLLLGRFFSGERSLDRSIHHLVSPNTFCTRRACSMNYEDMERNVKIFPYLAITRHECFIYMQVLSPDLEGALSLQHTYCDILIVRECLLRRKNVTIDAKCSNNPKCNNF